MKKKNIITILVMLIVSGAVVAGITGISSPAAEKYNYLSIRGKNVDIYGSGIYKDMSADVAVQGIAQDYVTVFIAVPLVITALLYYRKNSLRGRFLLAGSLLYFLVTYLFYLCMAMYNQLFLIYAVLLGASFFCLFLTMEGIKLDSLKDKFKEGRYIKYTGYFLIINSLMIALLWLQTVLPPLLSKDLYPQQLEHYTTLIVQGLDLGLLLPLAFVSGWLLIKKRSWGFLAGTIYIIFLALLMTALSAKIIAMALSGQNVIPVIIIIPTINAVAIFFSTKMLTGISS